MQKKYRHWWSYTLLVVLLIALTGCQTVQGLDIAQTLQNSATIKSGESKGSLQLELVPGDTGTMTDSQKAVLEALKETKITINHAVTQDPQHSFLDAELTYSKGTIPFQLAVEGNRFIVDIEGVQKPIVFDQTAAAGDEESAALSKAMQEQLAKSMEKLAPEFVKFFVTNAPNPERITVTNVNEQVNDQTLSLQKAHVEIDGSELAGLFKGLLTSILADEDGLKELIGQLYDVLIPVIKENIKAAQAQAATTDGVEAPDASTMLDAYLDNKELAVQFALTSVQQFLQKALDDYDKSMEEGTADPDSTLQSLLSSKTSLAMDLYIDQDKQIRKQQFDLQVPLDADSSLSALKLSFTSENWNLNKPLTASSIDVSGGTLDVTPDQPFNVYKLLSSTDRSSQFYKLLKEDLQVTKKSIDLIMDENSDYPFETEHPFINEDEVTMVPVRFISEQLGADVTWNDELKQITIDDAYTGSVIIMTLDSQHATVNGSDAELESAAVLKDGSTFVPVRFIAEALGAKVGWNNDTRVVSITRE